MPGGFPAGLGLCNSMFLGETGAQVYPIVWPSVAASANTKGSWFELSASTSADICWLEIYADPFESATAGVMIAIDIGIGASGSEQTIISNLLVSVPTNYSELLRTAFPLQIPAGTRVAVRLACTTVANTAPVELTVVGYDGEFPQMEGCAGVEGIGVSFSSSPYSTAFTPGASGALGSWTQIIASTTRDYYGLVVSHDGQMTIDPNFPFVNSDIGIGASGSEQVLIKDLLWQQQHTFVSELFPVQVPAGSRLSVRGTLSTAIGSGGLYGCSLFGVYL